MLRNIHAIASTRLDHGGTSRSVPALCDSLAELGCENHLITALPYDKTVACQFPASTTTVWEARESKRVRQWGVGAQFVAFLERLTNSTEAKCIVHDHAIWLATNHAVATFCRRKKVARVVSPRGMVGKWAMKNGGLKKRIAWLMYQQHDLTTASGFHATSHQEALEIRELGFRQPIAIVPNGIDLPAFLPKKNKPARRRALFLSRIHPKKGLLELVRAWKRARIDSTWELVIAGPDEQGFRAVVEKEVKRLLLSDDVKFIGSVDDSHKWQVYCDSDFFVLPSHNENFGIVIAEAMMAGLPVLTTRGTPWQAIDEMRCGWWIPMDEESLAQALNAATSSSPAILIEMGMRARTLIGLNYSSQESARKLLTFYEWLTIKDGNAISEREKLLNFCDFKD